MWWLEGWLCICYTEIFVYCIKHQLSAVSSKSGNECDVVLFSAACLVSSVLYAVLLHDRHVEAMDYQPMESFMLSRN